MTTKNTTAKGFINKKMNENVYKERRIVIDLIYRAKSLLRSNGIEMPRIDVRISVPVDKNTTCCGKGRMKDNIIWIPEDSLTKIYLYKIVLHELCHAIWGIEHRQSCKLMNTNVQLDYTDSQAEEIFLKYAKKHSKA